MLIRLKLVRSLSSPVCKKWSLFRDIFLQDREQKLRDIILCHTSHLVSALRGTADVILSPSHSDIDGTILDRSLLSTPIQAESIFLNTSY